MFINITLWAGGQKEDLMVKAEDYFEVGDYNNALLILTQVMKEDPNRFDEAQSLIIKIRKIRDKGNDDLLNLNKALEEGDLVKAQEYIEKIEANEKNPNVRTLNYFKKIKRTVVVVNAKKSFDEIMAQAAEEINQKEFYKAMTTYTTGFDLAKGLFDDLELGEDIENRVEEYKVSILGITEDIQNDESLLSEATTFINTVSEESDITQLSSSVNNYVIQMENLFNNYHKLRDIAVSMEELANSLKEQNNLEDDIYHMQFVYVLTRGRVSSNQDEGITGAIDIMWKEWSDELQNRLVKIITSEYSNSKNLLDNLEFESASETFIKMRDFAENGNKTIAIWDTYYFPSGINTISVEDRKKEQTYMPSLVYSSKLENASPLYIDLIDIYTRIIKISNNLDIIENIEAIDEARNSISTIYTDLSNLKIDIDELKNFDERSDTYKNISSIAEIFTHLEEKVNQIDLFSHDTEVEHIKLWANIMTQPYTDSYENAISKINESKNLLDGEEKNNNGVITILKYPKEAKQILSSTKEDLTSQKDSIDSIVEVINGEDDTLLNDPKIIEALKNAQEFSINISEQIGVTENLIKTADDNIFNAERAKQEGDDRLREAKSLLAREDFLLAKKRLDAAADSYDDSLSFQEDPVIRDKRDNEIKSLSEEIARIETEIVVKEIRKLINQGKDLYSQADYGEAEVVLSRAQSKWNGINTEPNKEIEQWLELIKTAVSINSGREILETDVLYAEMRNYLNLAQENYLEARELASTGNNSRVLNLVTDAEKKLLVVLQPFPNNEEARTLDLKLTQLKDPQAFNEILRNKFNSAVGKMNSNRQSAYIELVYIRNIDPKFPGLAAQITELEYLLGLKQRPPNPADLRKSNEEYNKANAIVRKGNRIEYPLAVGYLESALELNPNNLKAQRLIDEIRIGDSSSTITNVLSSQDETLYKQAEKEFINGNTINARIMIDRLWQKEDNKRVTKVIKLREKIYAKL